MTRKLDDKDLENISGGADDLQNVVGSGSPNDPTSNDPILRPGDPGVGGGGVHKQGDNSQDIGGGSGSDTFNKG